MHYLFLVLGFYDNVKQLFIICFLLICRLCHFFNTKVVPIQTCSNNCVKHDAIEL